ncbi:uncharacterized protein LOC17899774 [Capsella rubella]|uniref:uncharacterized protein LOC17899774 n=1 Tax=Capsella rubella TaxID=81985 RepID=UPI000CD4E139|nr:uncharacterized protein LOC17899774 [Capsella rubella]
MRKENLGSLLQFVPSILSLLGITLSAEKDTMIQAWFKLNRDSAEARNLTFEEIPQFFTWQPKEKTFRRRMRTIKNRRTSYMPSKFDGNMSLKLLFRFLKGPRSDEELRTFDGVVYESYKDACLAMGLLEA